MDRTVAEQEESILTLRAVEESERTRRSVIIAAEAEAQEKLVKDIKAAEAAEAAAVHRAAEQLTLADARLKTADLDAQAKLRLAEGVQAESAAAGLADVQVRDAEAEVTEKAGLAEAQATEARLRAEAEGARVKALAVAEGTQAQATADAAVIGEKLKAEAEGLTQKAAAMAALDEASRGHEEYRLRLAAEKEIRLAEFDVRRQIAEAQATVLATGLENADIDIVGGDSVFFDRLVSSVSMGRSVDGFVENSKTAQALAGPWLDGRGSFTDDLTRVLGPVSTGDVQNLTVSALLMRLMGVVRGGFRAGRAAPRGGRGAGSRGDDGVLAVGRRLTGGSARPSSNGAAVGVAGRSVPVAGARPATARDGSGSPARAQRGRGPAPAGRGSPAQIGAARGQSDVIS